MARKFVAQVQDAVQASQYTMETLAARLDKRPSSLYAELNPYPSETCTAKLGLEDAVKLMEITGDYTPLMQIADHFGFRLAKKRDEHERGHMREVVG